MSLIKKLRKVIRKGKKVAVYITPDGRFYYEPAPEEFATIVRTEDEILTDLGNGDDALIGIIATEGELALVTGIISDFTFTTEKKKKDKEIQKANSIKNTIWSSGKQVFTEKDYVIQIPESIEHVCRFLADRFSEYEFSIVLHVEKEGNVFRISEQFYVPEQEVTPGNVEFKNFSDRNGWNAILHKHPAGVNDFSGSDNDTINRNYDVSILWVNGHFETAVANLQLADGTYIQIRPRIEVIRRVTTLSEEILSRIQPKKYNYSKSYISPRRNTYPDWWYEHYAGGEY